MHRFKPACAPFRIARPASRRRGSIYLTVLGASMIVTILGVAGLYAVQLQGKISNNANCAMRATAAAISANEVARYLLRSDTSWRTRYINNKWVTDIPFDGGNLSFKLVDEIDAVLSNDSTQPVRLHAKATIGNAVRIQSVLLTPDGTGAMLPTAGTWRQEVLP